MMSIQSICKRILNESSAPDELCGAVDEYVMICREISGICPDPGFQAWSGDEFLDQGVAINPRAAAQCALDYRRTVVFLRGVHAAMQYLKARSGGNALNILYAGCGPFATLLLPLLARFEPFEVNITLLDVHQSSLDSVRSLCNHFGLSDHCLRLVRANACSYQHSQELDLVIAETMQKALEQEPQFAVTANLAPQLRSGGLFLPQKIQVNLSLAVPDKHQDEARQLQAIGQQALSRGDSAPLATVCTLTPEHAAAQLQSAIHNASSKMPELEATTVLIPALDALAGLEPILATNIQVFGRHRLGSHESQITLPSVCHELLPLRAGQRYKVCYQLGKYPKFRFESQPDSPC